MAGTKKTVWVSAKGYKHRVDTDSGKAACGLSFKEPWPPCNRSDPMCAVCMRPSR